MAPAVNAAGLACGLCANEAVAISRIAPQRNTDIGTDRPSDISNNESVDGIRARVDLSLLSEKIDIHKLAHSRSPDVQLCRPIFANRAGQIRISPYAVNISQRNSLTSRDYTRGANRYSLSLPENSISQKGNGVKEPWGTNHSVLICDGIFMPTQAASHAATLCFPTRTDSEPNEGTLHPCSPFLPWIEILLLLSPKRSTSRNGSLSWAKP